MKRIYIIGILNSKRDCYIVLDATSIDYRKLSNMKLYDVHNNVRTLSKEQLKRYHIDNFYFTKSGVLRCKYHSSDKLRKSGITNYAVVLQSDSNNTCIIALIKLTYLAVSDVAIVKGKMQDIIRKYNLIPVNLDSYSNPLCSKASIDTNISPIDLKLSTLNSQVGNPNCRWMPGDFEIYMKSKGYYYTISVDAGSVSLSNVTPKCKILHVPYGVNILREPLFAGVPSKDTIIIIPNTVHIIENLCDLDSNSNKYITINSIYFENGNKDVEDSMSLVGYGLCNLVVTHYADIPYNYDGIFGLYNNCKLHMIPFSNQIPTLKFSFNNTVLMQKEDIVITCAGIVEKSFKSAKFNSLKLYAEFITESFTDISMCKVVVGYCECYKNKNTLTILKSFNAMNNVSVEIELSGYNLHIGKSYCRNKECTLNGGSSKIRLGNITRLVAPFGCECDIDTLDIHFANDTEQYIVWYDVCDGYGICDDGANINFYPPSNSISTEIYNDFTKEVSKSRNIQFISDEPITKLRKFHIIYFEGALSDLQLPKTINGSINEESGAFSPVGAINNFMFSDLYEIDTRDLPEITNITDAMFAECNVSLKVLILGKHLTSASTINMSGNSLFNLTDLVIEGDALLNNIMQLRLFPSLTIYLVDCPKITRYINSVEVYNAIEVDTVDKAVEMIHHQRYDVNINPRMRNLSTLIDKDKLFNGKLATIADKLLKLLYASKDLDRAMYIDKNVNVPNIVYGENCTIHTKVQAENIRTFIGLIMRIAKPKTNPSISLQGSEVVFHKKQLDTENIVIELTKLSNLEIYLSIKVTNNYYTVHLSNLGYKLYKELCSDNERCIDASNILMPGDALEYSMYNRDYRIVLNGILVPTQYSNNIEKLLLASLLLLSSEEISVDDKLLLYILYYDKTTGKFIEALGKMKGMMGPGLNMLSIIRIYSIEEAAKFNTRYSREVKKLFNNL